MSKVNSSKDVFSSSVRQPPSSSSQGLYEQDRARRARVRGDLYAPPRCWARAVVVVVVVVERALAKAYLSHADGDQGFDLMEYHGLVGELDQRLRPAQGERAQTRAVAADQY